jgi:hypothetical protein
MMAERKGLGKCRARDRSTVAHESGTGLHPVFPRFHQLAHSLASKQSHGGIKGQPTPPRKIASCLSPRAITYQIAPGYWMRTCLGMTQRVEFLESCKMKHLTSFTGFKPSNF